MDRQQAAAELRKVAQALRAHEKRVAVQTVVKAAHVLRAAKGLSILREKARNPR